MFANLGRVQKEREFFARVKKHRVDPSTSSVGNPGKTAHPYLPSSQMTRQIC